MSVLRKFSLQPVFQNFCSAEDNGTLWLAMTIFI